VSRLNAGFVGHLRLFPSLKNGGEEGFALRQAKKSPLIPLFQRGRGSVAAALLQMVKRHDGISSSTARLIDRTSQFNLALQLSGYHFGTVI
jgi:hypothetical protein